MTEPAAPVDERGIPIERDPNGHAAPHCPAEPCQLCTGHSSVLRSGMDHSKLRELDPDERKEHYYTSWEWCQDSDTCAATVDWDKVFGR